MVVIIRVNSACLHEIRETIQPGRPGGRRPKRECQLNVYRDFQENITKTREGRYEVEVPWVPRTILSNNNLEQKATQQRLEENQPRRRSEERLRRNSRELAK